MSVSGFDDRLARERRARLQAERLLAQRSEELYSANKKLAEHAHALSHQVIEQREENAALVGRGAKAEAALELATEKADIAERRLWDSLRAVEDGFAIFDNDWRLVAANPAYIDAFDGVVDVAPGASYEAILRIAVEEGLVDLQGERPADWIEMMMTRWESTPIPQIDLKLWNGAYVRLLDKRTPQGDTVSIALDITDTIRREQDLRKARDAAEAAARAKSAFLANMSHEIRTPMNGVVSMADLLRETDLDEDQRLYADTIRNSGEALLVIINDVLDYSKIEADKIVLHPEPFDLQAMVHEIFHLLRPGIEGRPLELRLDYDIFLPDSMIGDRGRLRQVLTNLIGNAVKFTTEGHVTVHIVGEPKDPAPGEVPLRIIVEDTGIGIPHDMQAHIFGEFNQVESEANRRFDGTGLGLAISHKLVRLMGGSMWLDSEPGVGSNFGFAVTLEADPEAEQEPVAPLPAEARRVVVVTDTSPMRASLHADLMRLRADIVEVTGPLTEDHMAGSSGVVVDSKAALPQRLLDNRPNVPLLRLAEPVAGDPANMVHLDPASSLAELRAALVAPDPAVSGGAASGAPVDGPAAPPPAADPPSEPEPSTSQPHPPGLTVVPDPPQVDSAPLPATPASAQGGATEPGHPATEDMRGAPAVQAPPPPTPDPSPPPGPAPAPVSQAEKPAPSSAPTPAPSAPATEPAPPTPDAPTEPQPAPPPATASRLRVLAAEDNKTNQLVFKTMLKTLDLDLRLVENGRLALEAYIADPPDLMFTDISMPEMDGTEAARAIRAHEVEKGLQRVPIVAMTAHAMTGDKERILAAGIDDYLTKPLNKADLHERIRSNCPEGVDPFP